MISIIIPAYNASKHIRSVFNRMPVIVLDLVKNIYVINDGSTDNTQTVIEQLSVKYPQIKTINFITNKGYGSAVKYGLNLCKEDGCDFAVCLHADGQYPPEVICEFADYMVKNEIDILQGSRIASGTALSGGMPFYKYVAGKILTCLENIVFKLHMSDFHSGFLLYNRKALHQINFEKLSTQFDFDLEVIASARAKKLKISELPIPTRYADEVSHLNPFVYGIQVLVVLVKYLCGHYLH